ncbi:DUF488 domain-containing protein [Advenella mimigardefordensis]|uniref:DUF488 domain-containing protein n=1 Tax=Advenella mimigardefordensis (strain DSM 17166 / LMG 22922 / DPN7) TaxID=1247726 RepID=W0P6H5_ADVMD|nr:DUF488 family protein [Advenella mimigardefordensis]AHG62346.1 hypothetical protein MIM_c02440 [Advenella mimigardefordensis DPN7]
MKKDQIQTKRVYDEPADSDGYRVLVDRLWPRGIKKEALKHDLWLKEITPSSALRKWFHENAEQWAEFRQRYYAELDDQPAAVQQLIDQSQQQRVTLLYAAKDEQHNNANVLRDYLRAHAK